MNQNLNPNDRSHQESDQGVDPDAGLDARIAKLIDGPRRDLSDESLQGFLERGEKERTAQLQFLHALLGRVLRPDRAASEARIQKVMAAIPDDAQPGQPAVAVADSMTTRVGPYARRSRRAGARSWIAAAIVLFAVGFLWNWENGNRAVAAVETALRSASEPHDREYQVVATLSPQLGFGAQVRSTLYVRGGKFFALRHPALIPGTEFWVGGSHEQTWFVPARGPVLINNDPQYVRKWSPETNLYAPYLQITRILSRIKQRYRVSFLPDVTLPRVAGSARQPGDPQVPFQRIHGSLRGGWRREGQQDARRLPQEIDIWVDPTTGIVRRLTLNWDRSPDDAGLTLLTLDLAGTEPLAEDWYQHEKHHAAERRVIQMGKN